LSAVPAALASLLTELHQRDHTFEATSFTSSLYKAIDDRFAHIFLPGPALRAAALDPRYGNFDFLDSVVSPKSRAKVIVNEVWESLAAKVAALPILEPMATTQTLVNALTDIRAKFESNEFQSSIDKDEDPLAFWNKNPFYKLLIAPLLCEVFVVPASSADIERAFSGTGFLMDGRESMSLDNLEKLSVVRDHIRSAGFSFQDFFEKLSPPY